MADVLERISREARGAETQVRTEHEAARTGLKESAKEAEERVKASAAAAQRQTYGTFKKPLGEIREAIKIQKRRRELLGPSAAPVEPLREARTALKEERAVSIGRVGEAKKAALATVGRQVTVAEAELAASEAAALRKVSAWETSAAAQAIAEVRAAPMITPTLSARKQFDLSMKAGDIPKGATFVGAKDGGFEYSTPGEVVTTTTTVPVEVIGASGGDFKIKNVETGEVSWVKPKDIGLTPADYRLEKVRQQMISDKVITNGSIDIHKGLTHGYSAADLRNLGVSQSTIDEAQWLIKHPGYEVVPVTPLKDMVYVRDPKTGAEKWISTTEAEASRIKELVLHPPPSKVEQFYEIETDAGKVLTFSKKDWEKKSDLERLEVQLGYPISRSEYERYKLEKERGTVLPPWMQWTEPISKWLDVATYKVRPLGSELPSAWRLPLIHTTVGDVARGAAEFVGTVTSPLAFVVGTPYERAIDYPMHLPSSVMGYFLARGEAQKAWEAKYPTLTTRGFIASPLEEAGFPIAKTIYPDIAWKDITSEERWASALSTALWTTPLWVPPVVRGLKWAGAKVGVPELVSRFRTWPFSEPPGLQEIPGGRPIMVRGGAPGVRGPLRVITIPIDWNKLVPPRLKGPKVDWGLIDRALRAGEKKYGPRGPTAFQKQAAEAAAKAAERERVWAKPETRTPAQIARMEELTAEGMRDAAEAARRVRAFDEAAKVATAARAKAFYGETLPSTADLVRVEMARQQARVVQIAEARRVAFKEATTLRPGWVETPTGRYMPVGASPLLVSDLPTSVRITPTYAEPAYRVITKEAAKRAVQLVTPTSFAAVVKAGTAFQRTLARTQQTHVMGRVELEGAVKGAIEVRPTTVLKAATLRQQLKAVQVKPVAATGRQLATEAQTLQKMQQQQQLQPARVTSLAQETATRLKPATRLEAETLLRMQQQTQTQLQPAIETALEAATVVKTAPALEVVTEISTKTQMRAEQQTELRTRIQARIAQEATASRRLRSRFWLDFPEPKAKEEEKKPPLTLEGLPLVASRRQGFVTRDYYTDTEDVTARSRYTPEGSGIPYGTLKIWGDPPPGTVIHEDMGISDVKMDLDWGLMEFESDKEGRTDVGKRHPSPYKGMSVERKKQGPKVTGHKDLNGGSIMNTKSLQFVGTRV